MIPIITQALNELQTRLQVITTANGYYTDAGNNVKRGREQFNAMINPETSQTYDDFPVISIVLNSLSPQERANSEQPQQDRQVLADITILAADLIGQQQPQDVADKLFSDITQAITLDALHEQSLGLSPGVASFVPPELGVTIATVQQNYTTELIMTYGHQ